MPIQKGSRMKKIIQGRLYDTDTAKQVASMSSANNWSDHRHYEETLYQKKNGEFFLLGEGGPASKYATCCGNNCWDCGKKIIPLGYEDAQEWAENNIEADEYEDIFGEIAEDYSRKTISVSLSTSTIEILKRLAIQHNMNVSAYLETIILQQR